MRNKNKPVRVSEDLNPGARVDAMRPKTGPVGPPEAEPEEVEDNIWGNRITLKSTTHTEPRGLHTMKRTTMVKPHGGVAKPEGEENVTGGPGTTGFRKRIGRLNKLYERLTPAQRANHPGYRRLLAVIELEDALNGKQRRKAQEFAGPAEEQVERPQSTTHDKAEQEEELGVRRPLNDFLQSLGTRDTE